MTEQQRRTAPAKTEMERKVSFVGEQLANRAVELLHRQKGDDAMVNPIDHANSGQPTSDAYPSAGEITMIRGIIENAECENRDFNFKSSINRAGSQMIAA